MKTKSKSTVFSLLLVASTVLFLFGAVQPVQAQLPTVSPDVDPVNGFPVWYQDGTGLIISLCTDPNNPLCLADPVEDGNAFSETIGFGAEAFWWAAEAGLDINTPIPGGGPTGRALLVLAIEAAFADDAVGPNPGDQLTFSRLRIRMDAPVAGEYTVTHPYGTAVYDVVTAGPAAIRDDVPLAPGGDSTNGLIGDVGCEVTPCDFSLALGGATFPFLVAVNPAPPAGFVGNPAVDQTVTGSPTGNNFFRIEGPPGSNLDGLGGDVIETTAFSVSGQIFAAAARQIQSTFTRSATDGAGTIDISAIAAGATTVDVSGVGQVLPGVVEPAALTLDAATGSWSVSISIVAADVPPAQVSIVADRGLGTEGAAQVSALTDLVTITASSFDVPSRVLTVSATSSNQFNDPATPGDDRPILTVAGFGDIATPGGGTATFTVPAGTTDPVSVTVTSTSGGTATATVTPIGAVTPPGGGAVAGGGGSSGCFIDSLF